MNKINEYIIFIFVETFASILIGISIISFILYYYNYDVIKGLEMLLISGFQNVFNIEYMLGRSTFIILTALAFSIPFLCGLFNIGGEGQMYLGGLVCLVIAFYFQNPLLAIILGGLAGVALALIAVLIRIYRGGSEVIATIMLNWILYFLVIYLVITQLYDRLVPHESVKVPKGIRLGSIDIGFLELNTIFIIAIIFVILIYLFLNYTKIGYEIKVVGYSRKTAEYAGININKVYIYSMSIGGFSAGLSGALNVIGYTYFIDSLLSSMYGLGFIGIGVALMGRNNPIGIIFAGIFFSNLVIGGQNMQTSIGVAKELTDALIGILIIALAFPLAYRMLLRYIKIRKGVHE